MGQIKNFCKSGTEFQQFNFFYPPIIVLKILLIKAFFETIPLINLHNKSLWEIESIDATFLKFYMTFLFLSCLTNNKHVSNFIVDAPPLWSGFSLLGVWGESPTPTSRKLAILPHQKKSPPVDSPNK